MTKKRFTWEYSHNDSTGEIIDWIRNECLMTDYLQKYELEEWCQELNKIVDENNQLRKENEQLKKEKEFWKGDACNCSNYLSILSMDCQIVQEAICDLKSVIDVDTEAFRLLDKLDDKFDELNQHRIKMYSR